MTKPITKSNKRQVVYSTVKCPVMSKGKCTPSLDSSDCDMCAAGQDVKSSPEWRWRYPDEKGLTARNVLLRKDINLLKVRMQIIATNILQVLIETSQRRVNTFLHSYFIHPKLGARFKVVYSTEGANTLCNLLIDGLWARLHFRFHCVMDLLLEVSTKGEWLLALFCHCELVCLMLVSAGLSASINNCRSVQSRAGAGSLLQSTSAFVCNASKSCWSSSKPSKISPAWIYWSLYMLKEPYPFSTLRQLQVKFLHWHCSLCWLGELCWSH